MDYQKPAGISDEEWAKTPLAVRALLAQSMEQIHQLETKQDAPGMGSQITSPPSSLMSPADVTITEDDGATVNMPFGDTTPEDEDDGATVNMPFGDTTPEDDNDGATFAMPSDDTLTEDDGATVNMPFGDTAPDDEDEGATFAMPVRDTLTEDDGATVNMPFGDTMPEKDEGATFAMPFGDASLEDNDDGETVNIQEDEGATTAMPFGEDSFEDDGATVGISGDDGSTTAMSKDTTLTGDDGSTVKVPPPGDTLPADDDGGTVAVPSSTPTKVSEAETISRPTDDFAGRQTILQKRYQLRKILGKGGFGAAYLAEDIKLKRVCVIKQMLSPKNISPRKLEQNRANFEREASLLADLNTPGHNNIPDIYDYFSDDSGSYLVMKYIEGQSLKDILDEQQGKVRWQEAVRYTIDICSALNYMHTHSREPVMHRDIKPANILLGDDGRIWLVDFGLATADIDAASGLESSGSVGYAPFEQWIGEAAPPSDVYATGVTLHHLVTGRNPLDAFREDGALKVTIELLKTHHGHLEPIRKIDKRLPKELEEIITNVTAREPEERFTALQFQHQLEVLVSGTKDAALFTFKNGESAKTIGQLVDLCEQNRVEAQGYLYRGDFARWFTLINRNELAAAANEAVKQAKDEKQGLEKFLRLIMPNLLLRRLSKAGLRVARVGIQVILILLLAALLTIGIGTIVARWAIQRAIAGYDWNYYALDLDKENIYDENDLSEKARAFSQAFLDDVIIDATAPDKVSIHLNIGGVVWINLPATLHLENNEPQFTITRINGVPLYWITDNLTAGINSGIDEAHQIAPIDITKLEVNNQAVVFSIAKSGRVAYAPPPGAQVATESVGTPPPPTATPEGQALLAVFNDLDHPIILEIEGQTWNIAANDTKVVEQPPGTHTYRVSYVENGQLAAEGTITWTLKAYKWRIGVEGAFIQ